MDIAEFLTARYDEDERIARLGPKTVVTANWSIEEFAPSEPGAVPVATWVVDDQQMGVGSVNGDFVAAHIARHDPARVLRDVAAKRWMLIYAAEMRDLASITGEASFATCAENVERTLATPYAEHPDCDPAWVIDYSA